MKQKTAMMEMIEYLVQLSNSGHPLNSDYQDSILNKANKLLEKEEQQIINAYSKDNSTYWPHYQRFEKANQYFNETYGD